MSLDNISACGQVTDVSSAEWCQQQVAYKLTVQLPDVRSRFVRCLDPHPQAMRPSIPALFSKQALSCQILFRS